MNWRAYLRLEKMFLKLFQVVASARTGPPRPQCLDGHRRWSEAAVRETTRSGPVLRGTGTAGRNLGGALRFAFERAADIKRRTAPFLAGRVSFLERLAPWGATDFFQVSREFASSYPQRGLLVIISDFLDDSDCIKPLQYLAEFGHELLLLQVHAPEDREPPYEGELDLEDSETGSRLHLSFDRNARAEYVAAFDAYSDALDRVAERNGGRFVRIPTDVPVDEAIFGPIIRTQVVQ